MGGAGALLSKAIKKSIVVAYDDLGTEAIRELEVENFPAIVVIDSQETICMKKLLNSIGNKIIITESYQVGRRRGKFI